MGDKMVNNPDLKEALTKCSVTRQIIAIADYIDTYATALDNVTNLANEATQRSNAAYTLATSANNTANSALDKANSSITELNAGGDASTVNVNGVRIDGSSTGAPLPVASASRAGVMNTATYVNLQELNTKVESLMNTTITYIVTLPNDTPTQIEITNAYTTAYPTAPNPPLDGTTVIDQTRQLFYRWVKNGQIWIKTSGFMPSQFTNETLGTIKGSTTEGQIQAETDGTGSLVGYDALKTSIKANTDSISGLNTSITNIGTRIDGVITSVNAVKAEADDSLNSITIAQDATGVTITGTKNDASTQAVSITPVDTTKTGLVTPAMYNQWNSIQGSKQWVVKSFTFAKPSSSVTKNYTIILLKKDGIADLNLGFLSLDRNNNNTLSVSYKYGSSNNQTAPAIISILFNYPSGTNSSNGCVQLLNIAGDLVRDLGSINESSSNIGAIHLSICTGAYSVANSKNVMDAVEVYIYWSSSGSSIMIDFKYPDGEYSITES